jgi:putative DNA primase/helicase
MSDSARHHYARYLERHRMTAPAEADSPANGANGTDDSEHASESDPIAPLYSDDQLALRFTARYGDDLRFVAKWGRWMGFDSRRWSEDSTLRVFDRARLICREASEQVLAQGKPGLAKQLTAANTVAAVERMARSDSRTVATVDQWDADPWLLNTPAGSVTLRNGETRPHRREDYCTKITAVAPGGDCPRWLKFLDRITAGDRDLQAFLQRMVGYSLTGSTREEALFFLYGGGANGKSKFLGAVAGAMGDYATTAPIETFLATNGEHHPTDLGGLQGARLVTSIETEDGRRWAESKVKAMTGGDRISARFMRQDFFEYQPQFKLLIAGNHKPRLRSVDEAIRRRFHLVPFQVTIPPKERDLNLGDKLRAEWPGILRWAIDGCRAWQRDGLNPPEAVTAATSTYMAEEDTLALWINERCALGVREASKTTILYQNFCAWCEANNEKPVSSKAFASELDRRGYAVEHTMCGNIRRGIDLREGTP